MDYLWFDGNGDAVPAATALRAVAAADIVLLGETHDQAAHHLWQADVIAALAAIRPLGVGFEMFPARLDPALARWIAGEADEAGFLAESEWQTSWGFPAELYLPIFRLCRDLGLPMRGLNVPRALVKAVRAGGWDGVPEAERAGLTPARPSTAAYRQFIFDLTGGPRPGRAAVSADDPAFDGFVGAQEVWDRAFATHLLSLRRDLGGALAVGVIGQGHLQYGGGVGWQLRDMADVRSVALLPICADQPAPPAGACDYWCRLAEPFVRRADGV